MRTLASSLLASLLLATAALGVAVDPASSQDVDRVRPSLLREVVPGADRFDPAEGNPPVRRAWRGDELLGYVFLTSDLPPEERGYSGPVRAVVGMTPQGVLTGVRVTDYHESYMSTKGDFLRTPGFQEQYTGKYVGESFRVYDDIDGIGKVTISVRALSRGVRGAARRVAAAYGGAAATATARPVDAGGLLELSWFEIIRSGAAVRMDVTGEGEETVGISLIHLASEPLARYLVGGLYNYVLNAVERRGGAGDLVLYVVDGAGSRLPIQRGWSVTQDGRTTPLPVDDVVALGSPWEGLLSGETSMVGVLLLPEGAVDVGRPMTFTYDREPVGPRTVEYTSQTAYTRMVEAKRARATEAEAERAAVADGGAAPAAGASTVGASADPAAAAGPAAAGPAATAAASGPSSNAPLEAAASAPEPVPLDFALDDFAVEDAEQGALADLLASTSWSRVARMLIVLAVAAAAFFSKRTALRWVSLAATLVLLGWVDGAFLSISHLTGVIWVGPSAILNDLPLMIMVTFTVLTVLLWGRIFCGYLCPFGALQDFIDWIVPARFRRELPPRLHRQALKAKYGILALVLLPALAGVEVSLYQYFEPFGTVFFLSTNAVLWGIAAAILVASAVVPRFYCRYACPLGASLALASLVSWRRIPRVEQCDHCKVCEQKCPTGAIEGPRVDFKECVRCNVCEVQLIQRTGVCRHDMETIRPRLVQLRERREARVARSA